MKDVLNVFRDEAFDIAEKHGFHENINFGERLMLTVSELSEALEAHRNRKGIARLSRGPEEISKEDYEMYIRGSEAEEIADAVIRLFDLAGIIGMDLDWHVRAKMCYNKSRPYKHQKEY